MSDNTDKDSPLMEFPCSFPVKVMGKDKEGFRETVLAIASRHAGEVADSNVQTAPSRNGTFISITITIEATSQQQLDNLYRELSGHEDVLFSL